MRRIACLAASLTLLVVSPASAQSLWPVLEPLYEDLHAHPELSFQETATAAKMAERLKGLGFEVATGVGRTGVVGILKNGAGPTVMHACGHDVHMTAWVGAATTPANDRKNWSGTLMMVGQPAEEIGGGAQAMLDDGLFTRFPRPGFALAVHDNDSLPAGTVGIKGGPLLASADSVDIVVYGRGGHGARPHKTIDPIVIAAKIVLSLQTLVSRENDPFDPAVVTVGSIHGGTKHNIIPDEVRMQLTVRAYKGEVRERLLRGIERIARDGQRRRARGGPHHGGGGLLPVHGSGCADPDGVGWRGESRKARAGAARRDDATGPSLVTLRTGR